MINPSVFQENLKKFSRFFKDAPKVIPDLDCSAYEFCKTSKGELNLLKNQDGKKTYFHSQDGAVQEAAEWVEKVFPLGYKAILVYGLGLGYYYDALKSWLKESSGRFLVFIDDDLAAIKRFLETDKASEILNDTQVIVQFFVPLKKEHYFHIQYLLHWFTYGFCNSKVTFKALEMYAREKKEDFLNIQQKLTLTHTQASWHYYELFANQDLVTANLFENLPYASVSGNGLCLFDHFPSVPVIICGAGPSISNQLYQLKQLRNKAIIVTSGTALNVLTRNGLMPHFSVLIDPYSTQESRFMTNWAFEVPFIYTNRFYHPAFKLIHSPRLFLYSGNGPLATWFENKIREKVIKLEMTGISTTNVCGGIFHALGCNPMILAGVDMAYTDSTRYAEGVEAHPAADRSTHEELIGMAKETIPATGVNNEGIQTKWNWIFEASFFTEYAKQNPEKTLLNVTERGIDIIGIPHTSLKEVVEQHLQTDYDLQNWIHCEVQEAYKQAVPIDKILDAMNTWGKSIEKCLDLCTQILQEIERQIASLTEEPEPISIRTTSPIAEFIEEFEKEEVFISDLDQLEGLFIALAYPDMNKLTLFEEQFSKFQKASITLDMEKEKYALFKVFLENQDKNLKRAFQLYQEYVDEQKALPSKVPKFEQKAIDDVYEFGNGFLTIKDIESDISFHESFSPRLVSDSKKITKQPNVFITDEAGVFDGQALMFYPDGNLKAECYYINGQLHGPSTFYHSDGTLSAQGWFIRGNRVGKSRQNYATGEIYSLLHYNKEGNLSGLQKYYYPSGILKTMMQYDNGELEGELNLFYPSGIKKRQQHFSKGKLNGKEYIWNKHGRLIIESEFKSNMPTGKTSMWHPNGNLAKEIIFYDNSLNFDLQIWSEDGKLIHKQMSLPSNPFDDILKQSSKLRKSLEEATALIESLKKSKN